MAVPWAQAIPLLLGAISAGGEVATNRANARMAREQMDFQERMSSTSAQRSVEDYRAAGLNPALAYERGASSPGGASAVMGNVAGAAVSSAQNARAMNQGLSIAKEQAALQRGLTLEQANATRSQAILNGELAAKAIAERAGVLQNIQFAAANQPYSLRQSAAEALLKEFAIPGSRNEADWQKKLMMGGPAMNSARTAMQVINAIMGRR